MWYRLVFKEGTRGAWTQDFERTQKMAEFFGAEIETKEKRDILRFYQILNEITGEEEE